MTSKNDDPWKDWRKKNGEFRSWLHTWGYNPDNGELRMIWSCVPWVCREAPSGEFITAMYHMGVLKTWPGEWKRWSPPQSWRRSTLIPRQIYGVVLPLGSHGALKHYLQILERRYANQEDFLARVMKSHLLFTQETMNENTRSSEAGSASV